MTNVVELKTRLHRNPAFTRAYNDLPLASAATITLQQALATNANPAALRAVADWNERKSYDERRRKARSRHKAQAAALRAVADEMEAGYVESYREAA
jgi:hypothetical protein